MDGSRELASKIHEDPAGNEADEFAMEAGIAPGIVVGRLQHNKARAWYPAER